MTAGRLVAATRPTARLAGPEVDPLLTCPDAVLALESRGAANRLDCVEVNAGSFVHVEDRVNRAGKVHAAQAVASLGQSCPAAYFPHRPVEDEMSRTVAAEECTSLGATQGTFEAYPNRDISLGKLTVTRVLPIRDRRLIGPWCFLDRFGPLSFGDDKPMDVAPHPHTGLQTVTWLLEGEVLHDDSLGSVATAKPGGVNVMTSGRGIAHAEQTPRQHTGRLNGAQLWVALPDEFRQVEPSFDGIERVPLIESPGGITQVFAGSLAGQTSPGRHFSELTGADIQVHPGLSLELELQPHYEHAVLVLDGDCSVEGEPLQPRMLYYLGVHRSSVTLASRTGGRLMLIGGPPFPERILMWWNFVARSPEEIAQFRDDWEQRRRFGDVPSYQGARLDAPELARLARPNAMS